MTENQPLFLFNNKKECFICGKTTNGKKMKCGEITQNGIRRPIYVPACDIFPNCESQKINFY